MKKTHLNSILIAIMLMLTLLLTSCSTPSVTKVELGNETTAFDISSFSIQKLKLIVYYDNDETSIVRVNDSMLSEEDVAKLTSVGTYDITINYQTWSVKATITLEENADFMVSVINITIDDTKYTASTTSNKYVPSCTHDTQYVYIIVKVILNEDYYFNPEGIELNIYNEYTKKEITVDPEKYSINGDTLEYKYKDPYWSPTV